VLLIVLVVASAAVVTTDSVHAVARRNDEIAAGNLEAGMADQQTGLLTYLQPSLPDSPALYAAGRREAERSLTELRASTSGTADTGAEEQVEAAVGAWQRWADAQRSWSLAAHAPITDPVVIDQGRFLFSAFTIAQQTLVDRLRAESSVADPRIRVSTWVSLGVALGGPLPVAVVLAFFALTVIRHGLNPLMELANAAHRIAVEGRASIPHIDSAGEVGELARALQRWQEASAERTVLAEEAPIGICRTDAQGRFLIANAALQTMLGYPRDQLVGQPLWTFLHPDDLDGARDGHQALMDGAITRYEGENRWHRSDGSVVWCSMVAGPVLGVDGRPETLSVVLEDITGRKQQVERAVQIQRELLPKERPRLEGYELAAACIPAQDVGGDFYDWVGPQDGQLDLTVADVMGKGVGAALVMATLRAALRSAPHELSPAARVGLASESISHGLTDDGLFVTLFHARLDVRTGVLRYVDAGHGYCVIRRADGGIVPLVSKSLPVGVLSEAVYEEGQVRMEPGDSLLAYTDGLVEIGDQTIGLRELTGELGGAESAEGIVGRLVSRVRGQQEDDVTVVLLQRTGPRRQS
jgi:PAS domain S-box-containing protein